MSISAFILGIIGGLIAMSYAMFQPGYGLVKILSLSMPVVGLIGAGLARPRPRIASILMLISGVGVMILWGFIFLSTIPGILLLAGALLAYLNYRFNW